MVSLIKNQLLKHLSRFTKNLKEDQINLSTFKGEGDLANLELDELVLTDLLELPSWLRLTSARCNRVHFRIQWTKLKSVPIFLTLDEVQIEVETCEDLRSMSVQGGLSSMAGGKYSFIHKVIDGMTIAVNTVLVTFRSPAFVASLQISRILVESRSPQWQRSDLRYTRIKDPDKGQLLIFKELEWQTVRIEARSTQDANLTPLRLLTNRACCRIVIKKRLSDCFVMGSRLLLILDDLLWVLTDSQLKAALHFLNSLSDLVQKATEVTRKRKAARKLEELPEYEAQISQQARKQGRESDISRLFSRYDVVETSYHFMSRCIDLHFCDDAGPGRSCHPELKDGGALQISLQYFQFDYYPYHLAIGDRQHWPKHGEFASSHSEWLQQSLILFKNSFLDLVGSDSRQHIPLSRSSATSASFPDIKSNGYGTQINNQGTSQQQESLKKACGNASGVSSNSLKNYVGSQLAKLMTSCLVVRIEDFTLYRVTTPKRKQMPKDFISGDRDRLQLPDGKNTIFAELTYYYYPGDIPFPLPPPKIYIRINPIQIYMDVLSILWVNSYALNLHQSLQQNGQEANNSLPYVDVKVEAVMPRVILESWTEHPNQRDRPRSLHLEVSRVTITNVRSTQDSSSRADLAKCIHSYQLGSLFFGSDFPSKPDEYHVVNNKFISHMEGTDNVRTMPCGFANCTIPEMNDELYRELLWVEAKDVWCIHLDPLSADFYGTRALGSNRATPFLDALPVTLWLYLQLPESNFIPASTRAGQNSRRFNLASEPGGLNTTATEFLQPQSQKIPASIPKQSTPSVVPSESSRKRSQDGIMEPQTADVHALIHVSNLVSLQLNHYQLLFLLRLAEELAGLATFLTLDTIRILDREIGSSLVMGALIPQVEATFVMPSQTPGKESSGGDVESFFQDSSSLGDELIGSTTVERSGDMSGNVDRASVHFQSQCAHVQSQTAHSQSQSAHFQSQTAHFQSAWPRETISRKAAPVGNGAGTPISEVSPSPSLDFHNVAKQAPHQVATSVPSTINSIFSSSRKAFSRVTNSIDAALKPTAEDTSDTVSLDGSSDSENYVMLGAEGSGIDRNFDTGDAMFHITSFQDSMPRVEMASEVLEEDPTGTIVTTPSERADSIDSSIKRRDLVSVVTFKLAKVEFIQQSKGFTSCIKANVTNVTSEECGAIPWDEFQSKFSSRSRAWAEMPLDTSEPPRIQARLDHTMPPEFRSAAAELKGPWDRSVMQSWFKDLLEVRVTDLPVRLCTSTIIGLADLVEDEVIQTPMPMEVFLENLTLHIVEDRSSNNITSPGAVPIDVSVTRLHIKRDGSGVFQIEPPGPASVEVSAEIEALQRAWSRTASENEELRRRQAAFELLSEENHRLRRFAEEADALRSCLAKAQDDVSTLLNEKRALLEEMESLKLKLRRSSSSAGSSKR